VADIEGEAWEDGAWVNDERWIYQNREDGLVEDELHLRWNKTYWEIIDRVYCSYDGSSRLSQRITQSCTPTVLGGPSPDCIDVDSTLYVYDADGRITLDYRRQRGFGGGWKVAEPIRYTYDDAGRLTETVDTRARARSVFTYDGSGRLSERVVFASFQGVRTRYAYQHAGILTRVAEDAWNSQLQFWAERGETRYQYDPTLALGAMYRLLGGPREWIREEYRYDARGRLEEVDRFEWKGSAWADAGSDTYVYDDGGYLREYRFDRYVEGWDGGQQLLRQRILYDYAVATATENEEPTDNHVLLEQNYPNPFRTVTTISYTLPRPSPITLSVFDIIGRKISVLASGLQSAGRHEVSLDASGLSSGFYVYRLDAADAVQARRMLVAR
jgi:hypothetical protein